MTFLYNCGVYRLIFPNGKCYIGQSVNLQCRMRRYEILDCKEQLKIYRAIIKYEWDNIKIEILLYTKDENNLNKSEVYFINKYDSIENGYNISKGGNCVNGYKLSREHVEKIRKANTGKVRSTECRERNRLAHIGKICSEETKIKMSQASMGKPKSEEMKRKTRDRMSGSRLADSTKMLLRQDKLNKKEPRHTSRYLGVHKQKNRWLVNICINRKKKYIGSFKTENEAAIAYNKAAINYSGDFACLNTIKK